MDNRDIRNGRDRSVGSRPQRNATGLGSSAQSYSRQPSTRSARSQYGSRSRNHSSVHTTSDYARGRYNFNESKRKNSSAKKILFILIGLIIAGLVVFGAIKIIPGLFVSQNTVEDQLTAEDPEENANLTTSDNDKRLVDSSSLNDVRPTDKVVYLTFDDGPSTNTDRILATLKEYGVKATWFIKGNSESIEKVKDIWEAGHQVAVHTYTHDYDSIYQSEYTFWNDIDKAASAIQEQLGFAPPKILRFPGGSFNGYNRDIADGLTDSVGERGWHYFDWNVSCGDGSSKPYTAQELYGFVVGEAEGKNSCCVLMHDSAAKDATAESVALVIQYFLDNGYAFDVINADTFGYHF